MPSASSRADGLWKLAWTCSPVVEDSLVWRLEQVGIHHTATVREPRRRKVVTVLAWVDRQAWSEQQVRELASSLANLAAVFQAPVPHFSCAPQIREEWASSWKQHWRPDPVGNALLVLPAWLDCPPEQRHRRVLRLAPGRAFGTGEHPSTRLCMEALEGRQGVVKDALVVDLGCGSGILGITALALGAARVVAGDVDPMAVSTSRENGALNAHGPERLQVVHGSSKALLPWVGSGADVLLCNILAPVIMELAPDFAPLLKTAGGQGWLSGLLISQADDVQKRLADLGWTAELAATRQGWALLAFTTCTT
ncbi:MAG: 50S ribosomal protein L11 methyltransferase [Cyanobacteria bacterium MAG CAR4_bin_6]|nr:50S ribosomal protein L11 methyltransferase [Cyanobacteria bacterium MAG CAR4_bin_6]MCY4236412.1 50S ribosomal protein L11 methyltransferase [Cyanobacteria bacterium MAG CAR2_bin_4]